MALKNAMESPIAICAVVLSGNDPVSLLASPAKSSEETKMTPTNELNTPTSLRTENASTRKMAQNINVQTLLVDVKMVTLATLVYSRQADAK